MSLIIKKGKPKEGEYNDVRKAAIPALYGKVARKYGYKALLLKAEIYKEEESGAGSKTEPMVFIAIKLYRRAARQATALKQLVVEMLRAGKPVEDICKATGFKPNQVRAFKAHITMGTY